jgi:phage portal protein BeeE
MARGRFANRGFPDILLGLLGFGGGTGQAAMRPGAQEVARLALELEQKHRGEDKVGQAHIIAGDFKAQPMGQSLVDNQYMEGRRFNRDTVMQTFRRPPELAGVLDNANRSTIDVAEDLEARANTQPKLDRWRAALQDEVAPEFGADLVVTYASPVPADRELQAGYVKALPAAFRLDEIRARAGEMPLGGDEGQALYKAPGAVPVAGSPSSPTAEEKTP